MSTLHSEIGRSDLRRRLRKPINAGDASLRAFTLVELLAVIVLILLLLGLSLSSLGFLDSSVLTSDGNKTADLISAARLNSMAKGGLTAVVIADDTALGDRHHRRAMILMEKGTTDLVWRPLGKWEHLSERVMAVDPASGDASFFTQTPGISIDNLPRLQTKIVPTTSVKYQVFLPSGRLSTRDIVAPAAPALRIVGIRDVNVEEPDNYYGIKLNLHTGIPAIQRP